MINFIRAVINLIRGAGLVRPMDEYMAGQQAIAVRVSPYYTIFTVNGVEFFFDRDSGKFDGYGAMAATEACETGGTP